jgi:hypothetical protein
MSILYHVTMYPNGEPVSVTREELAEALRCILSKVHSASVKISKFDRNPKFLRPIDYAVDVTYELHGQVLSELVHVYKRQGTLDTMYLEISNELIFGKQV